eukprot:CAMPEP_0194158268 /NCGR_PEP_ID=MMETSP0152-20130528/75435_1 /TAXON_ID=1049557 /ORGANISM="Thalassiothrix antarctica, Strain L6-D1" /LENGTH=62 /DNA_ID=CAMNT_0038867387 /DNA_START=348 /DNA_END=536 /DNA_ORIENTATION=-
MNVVDMSSMFQGATSFDHDILSFWNLSNVRSMNNMFQGASSFVSTWSTINDAENTGTMFALV